MPLRCVSLRVCVCLCASRAYIVVQVDNPMVVMDQETSKKFISASEEQMYMVRDSSPRCVSVLGCGSSKCFEPVVAVLRSRHTDASPC